MSHPFTKIAKIAEFAERNGEIFRQRAVNIYNLNFWFDFEVMNCKAKGNRNEYKSIKWLKSLGYEVFRMAGSLGVFDLIAISKADFLLIQVKTNRMPSKAEMKTIKAFECPANAKKFVHIWQDRTSAPIVREVG